MPFSKAKTSYLHPYSPLSLVSYRARGMPHCGIYQQHVEITLLKTDVIGFGHSVKKIFRKKYGNNVSIEEGNV